MGYIRDVEGVVNRLGGRVLEKVRIKNIVNPLNPTVCFIISASKQNSDEPSSVSGKDGFSVPGTNYLLEKEGVILFFKGDRSLFPHS